MKNNSINANMIRNSHGSLAEFGPALLLFFVFLLVPAFAFLRLGVSTAAVYFVVDRAADAAAKSPYYDSAWSRANEVIHDLANLPIARFAGLNAKDVRQVTLYVDEHVTATETVNVLTREQLLQKTICPEVNSYEYEVQSSFTVQPLLPGCALPWLGRIPYLCASAPITVRAVRVVEYPNGLQLSAK